MVVSEIKIKELITEVKNNKIWVPEFQRNYVWEKYQMKLLCDSIYRDYTISSILTWEGSGELARRRVGGSLNEIKVNDLESNEKIKYLLDGQQRITTLMSILTDIHIYKNDNIRNKFKVNIYFDIIAEKESENKFLLDSDIVIDNNHSLTIPELEKINYDGYQDLKFRYINLKEIYEYSETSKHKFSNLKEETKKKLNKAFEEDIKKAKDLHNISKKIDEYEKYLDLLKRDILDREIVEIKQNGDLQSVLDIFERINTKNTRLNIFDIMVAKTYKKLENNEYFSLRDYLNIIRYNGEIKSSYLKNLELVNISNSNKKIVDDETFLFLILIILKEEFIQKKVLKITTDDLLKNLKLIKKIYDESISKFSHFKINSSEIKNFKPLLKFFIFYCKSFRTKELNKEELFKTWFWNTILFNRYPGSQNEKIKDDTKKFKLDSEKSFKKHIKNTRTISFEEKYLDAYYNKSNKLYTALLVLYKSMIPKDFYLGINPNKESFSFDRLEEHHIFPHNSKFIKKLEKEDNFLINNIANIALIVRDTNNKKINNKNPSIYIKEIENEYIKKNKLNIFYEIMNSQLITKDMVEDLKTDNFKVFLEKRTNLIKEKIYSLCEI